MPVAASAMDDSPLPFTCLATAPAAGPEESFLLARALARIIRPGDCIALEGALGAGKTTFAQGFIRTLFGEETEVTSPTFTLVHEYEKDGVKLRHCDFYRVDHVAELDELGLEDESAIMLVEWPEIAAGHLSASRLTVEIEIGTNKRLLRFLGPESWRTRLSDAGIGV